MGEKEPKRGDEPLAPVSRPTIRPDFDPQALAEQSEIRERAPTITDEVALEAARVASLPSRPPLLRGEAGSMPEILAGVEEDLMGEDRIAVLRDRLSPLQRIPHLSKKLAELGEMIEDPKTAYVLGFVDGVLPLETIVDVTGLPEADTLEVLERGHILFKPST